MRRSPLVRSLLASAALVAAISLAGCNTDGTLPTNAKAMAPLSPRMISEIESKNMDKDSPILVRVFKQESELEVWKQDRSGRYALLKTYPICRWSGELGPKFKEGDRQAPEGFYTITPAQMNPNSQYYLSFDLGYPNAYDRSHGRTGAHLMVHGDCSSRGCYSMTDEAIAEIYALVRESFAGGNPVVQLQIYPFRMTPQRLAADAPPRSASISATRSASVANACAKLTATVVAPTPDRPPETARIRAPRDQTGPGGAAAKRNR